jgi:hypothetical protein
MTQCSMMVPDRTVGLDISDRMSHLYVVDGGGACLEEGRVRTTSLRTLMRNTRHGCLRRPTKCQPASSHGRGGRDLGQGARDLGRDPGSLGLDPRSLGQDPRSFGRDPRSLGQGPRDLG